MKSKKVKKLKIIYNSYSLSKFFIENEISKITNYISEQELEKINIELFFQKEAPEIYNNKNIEQNILFNNFNKENSLLKFSHIKGENSKILLNLKIDEKLSEYFNNSFTNEIQKSEKVENNIYFD